MVMSKVYIGLIILLVGLGVFKYIEMSATINSQNNKISNYERSLLSYQIDVQTERKNVTLLKDSVNDLNKEIKKLQVKNTQVLEEYNRYISKPVQERFSGKIYDFIQSPIWSSNNCQDATVINQTISEINFEDL